MICLPHTKCKNLRVFFVCLLFCLTAILFSQSCNKSKDTGTVDPPAVDTRDSTVNIKFFKIEKKNNPQLLHDIQFEIKGNTIVGRLSRFHHTLVPSFSSNASKVTASGIDQVSEINKVDLRTAGVYSFFSENGKRHDFRLIITWDGDLPQISINTQGNMPIVSKDNYLPATINIDGKNIYSNFSGTTQIRGRGNSTWSYPKKPYRLKLDTETELLGLSAEKDWVLLANYLDETYLLNSIAFHVGKQLNIPYTNSGIPVELTVNGQYAGIYLFTEQVEVASDRVNIGDQGLLLELDSYYDEDPKFTSDNFKLPIMVKHPKVNNATDLSSIKAQFQQMESLVFASSFPDNNYLDFIDNESIANFLMVFMLTDNEELNHPKSVYINKKANEKFVLGPLWDFDWAYGYEGTQKHFWHYDRFFWTGSSAGVGTRFFQKLLSSPQTVALLKQKWASFATNNKLQIFVDDWAFILKEARERDYALWKRGNVSYQTDITALKTWLTNRISYLTTYINGLQ